jgi:hypothetical protein
VKRVSHHSDYAKFIEKLYPNVIILDSYFEQVRFVFKRRSIIIFLDIDLTHSFFFPLMLVRDLLGLKSITISVSSEKLKEKIGLRASKWTMIHRIAMYFLRNKANIKNVTIHNKNEEFYSKFYSDFIKDPQYWDLPYLAYGETYISGLKNYDKNKPIISVLGTFNDKRYSKEVKQIIKSEKFAEGHFSLLIAGKMTKKDEDELKNNPNIILFAKPFSNEELMYLYKISDFIVCCYRDINRPSGFFGRALQLNKFVIVFENSYLSEYNYGYQKIIVVENIKHLLNIDYSSYSKSIEDKGNSYSSDGEFEKLTEIIFKW